MELTGEISIEHLPVKPISGKGTATSASSVKNGCSEPAANLMKDTLYMSAEEVSQHVETILLKRIRDGDDQALFQLGQVYFEQEDYGKAQTYFEQSASKGDYQAMFQLGVILFDGLAGHSDYKRGMECMNQVATCTAKRAKHLLRAAQYNVGRAYYQGFGVRQSDENAEKYWLLAADDGNPKASLKAQCALGMFYCRPETLDLKKAFFWHSEACGNGSLESQGVLGVMYLNGLGCKKDINSAFTCLREAAERGNVYAMGNLVSYYFKRKLFTKTVELAARVAQFTEVRQLADETDCLPSYVAKGIATSCFYFARCLHCGHGIKQDIEKAKTYYSKSYQFDPDVCAYLQSITQHGEI